MTSVTALLPGAPIASRLPPKAALVATATDCTPDKLVKPKVPLTIALFSTGAEGFEISASVTALLE